MLALQTSSRGARLHTFEHEDRAYTSTPTKIGGHCLDHVRSGLALTWRSERGKLETSCADSSSNANNHAAGSPPISATFGSKGRFGGLCGVVLQLSHPTAPLAEDFSLRMRRQETSFMPRYSTPLGLPPNIPFQLAGTASSSATAASTAFAPAAAAAADWQQREFGPQWPAEDAVAVAPRSENDGPLWDDRREHFRNVASAATGHAGALMAIMLSKLANSTDRPLDSNSPDDSFDAVNRVEASSPASPSPNTFTHGAGATATATSTATTVASTAAAQVTTTAAVSAESSIIPFSSSSLEGTTTALPSTTATTASSTRTELHRSVDTIAEGLASPGDTSAEGTGASTSRGRSGSWAWKARLEQAPAYSKLHRYSFVRELGRGTHGTVLLVRKKVAPAASRSRARIGDGTHDTRTAVAAAGSTGSAAAAVGGGTGTTVGLRVLKESQHLKEAVNEARLLLLAGSGSGSGGDGAGRPGTSGFRTALDKPAADDDDDDVSVGPKRGVVGPAEGIGHGKWRGAASGRVHQSGEVVQLYDFFVETLGHRSLAFLELEYCEGGDLHELILGRRSEGELSSSVTQLAATVPGGVVAGVARGGLTRGESLGLPAARIARVALGLCEGLEKLHERGVLHRDLKPGNILLTRSGAIRVADLGVSTHVDSSRPLTENAAGTIPFMAPEVRKFLLGSKVAYSGKADVWAVGALVYAMSIGDPAPAELVTASRPQLVSVVKHQTGSEALSLVAHRALDPDPCSRPSVHQVSSMLRDCCRREGWILTSPESNRLRSSKSRLPLAGLSRL